MANTNDVTELLSFGISLLIFYVLCLIGSIGAYFVKRNIYKTQSSKKKKLKNMKFSMTFATSLLPAVIATMLDSTSLMADVKYTYEYGFAIFLGVVGEDISSLLLSLKNVLLLLRALVNGADGIKEIADKITDDDDSDEAEHNQRKKTEKNDTDSIE